MDVNEAYELVAKAAPYEPKAFYGPAEGVGLGAGLIYSNVMAPAFDTEESRFKTILTPAYVITHECDIDQSNERPFNEAVLVCPIIEFSLFVECNSDHPNLAGFLGDLINRRVPRLLYLPGCEGLPHGGVMYFNRMSSTHVEVFEKNGATPLCAVSSKGLREVDIALQNLLLREKADALFGMPSGRG